MLWVDPLSDDEVKRIRTAEKPAIRHFGPLSFFSTRMELACRTHLLYTFAGHIRGSISEQNLMQTRNATKWSFLDAVAAIVLR